MNRRGFLSSIGKAVAGFSILPPATTYNRVWRTAVRIDTEYNCVMVRPYAGELFALVDRATKEMLEAAFVHYWRNQRASELCFS